MIEYLLVGIGGFIGSILRYAISKIPIIEPNDFPLLTLAINFIGSLVMGIVVQLTIKNRLDFQSGIFFRVGICGGFTTFSTFALESIKLIQNGKFFYSLLYVFLTVALGIVSIIIGQRIVNLIN